RCSARWRCRLRSIIRACEVLTPPQGIATPADAAAGLAACPTRDERPRKSLQKTLNAEWLTNSDSLWQAPWKLIRVWPLWPPVRTKIDVEKRWRRSFGRNRFAFLFPPFAPPVGLRGGTWQGVLIMAVNEGLAAAALSPPSAPFCRKKYLFAVGVRKRQPPCGTLSLSRGNDLWWLKRRFSLRPWSEL